MEIDGVLADSLVPSPAATHRTIRTNLSTANHTIRIILRNEDYTCKFGGFYLADGKSLVALAKPSRRMEIIGDSWTAAYVTNAPSSYSGSEQTRLSNANQSYARLVSKAFHAEDKIIARRGCGMANSLYGDPTMPTRYPKTLVGGTANWDFASWIPHVVVIFLGINDFNGGGSTSAGYRTAYQNFITTVRSHYTNVPIIGVAVSGYGWTEVQQVAAGFTNLYTLSSPITLATATALWSHPSPAQERTIANALIPVVMQATGWDTTAPTGIDAPHLRRETRNPIDVKSVGNNSWKIVLREAKQNVHSSIEVFSIAGKRVATLAVDKSGVSEWNSSKVSPGSYLIGTQSLGWEQIVVSPFNN